MTFATITKYFNGRTTFFAVLFTVIGVILAFLGKLTTEYIMLVAAIQALILGHSIKQDVLPQETKTVEAPKDGSPVAPPEEQAK